MIDEEIIKKQIGNTLESFDLGKGEKYEGKVRDNFLLGEKRLIITTDRISAFDRVLTTIPFKGQVLNQISEFWFNNTKDICRNHMLQVPDPNVMVVKDAKPFEVEMVIRGYITGVTKTSIWYNYSNGARKFCGIDLPEGLKKDQKLDEPIITPTTKAAHGGHDESISKEEILSRGLVSKEDYEKMEEATYKLFEYGQKQVAKQGLILVDTKYEFGKDAEGVMVIDEMHTPDSSRFWVKESYDELFSKGEEQQKLDKEYVRKFLADQGFIGDGEIPPIPDEVKVEAAKRYITAFEKITGKEFLADNSNVTERIKNNLKEFI
ncbi:phosphoribosylaminoimidazolesuccinocarboxamide synthase [Nanoarchaeota archaeon]